jgi:hypothetical protein
MRQYGLRDDQWVRVRDLLPGREGPVDWARRQQAKILRTADKDQPPAAVAEPR